VEQPGPKGIPYLVDCNVTGSNPGTPTTPSIENLIAPGGLCAGALVILQEDNARPHHTDGNYHAWMTDAFAERDWRIELQAPQGRPLLLSSPS
jgi:hypothetical protein